MEFKKQNKRRKKETNEKNSLNAGEETGGYRRGSWGRGDTGEGIQNTLILRRTESCTESLNCYIVL